MICLSVDVLFSIRRNGYSGSLLFIVMIQPQPKPTNSRLLGTTFTNNLWIICHCDEPVTTTINKRLFIRYRLYHQSLDHLPLWWTSNNHYQQIVVHYEQQLPTNPCLFRIMSHRQQPLQTTCCSLRTTRITSLLLTRNNAYQQMRAL